MVIGSHHGCGHVLRKLLGAAALLAGLAACSSLPSSSPTVQVSEVTVTVAQETLAVHRYAPLNQPPRGALVFVHGFLRGPERHADMARDLADAGVLVLMPQLASPFADNSLARDAQVLRALHAMALRETASVAWGGFSRGGGVVGEALLAQAGSGSAAPAALLLLDPVFGARAAQAFAQTEQAGMPVRMIAAPAAGCNARGRAFAWPALQSMVAQGRAQWVDQASHCDAESPSDVLCAVACGEANPQRQRAFLQSAISFVLSALPAAATTVKTSFAMDAEESPSAASAPSASATTVTMRTRSASSTHSTAAPLTRRDTP